MLPWEMLQCSKGNGDGGVEMSTGDVAGGEDDDHNGEARRAGTSNQSL